MSRNDHGAAYDASFIMALFDRFCRRSIDESDAQGLAGMLNPVERLARQAEAGLGFDDEPADFIRVMRAERSAGDRR